MILKVVKTSKKTKNTRTIKGYLKCYSFFGDKFFDLKTAEVDLLSFFETGTFPASFDFSYSRGDRTITFSGRFERKRENGNFMFVQTHFRITPEYL